MLFFEAPIPGAFTVRQKRLSDDRGFFARGWCTEEFRRHGLNPSMVQLNVSFSPLAGTIRGMHYQLAPDAEAKFICCTRGAVFDVVVDLRPDSPAFGRWFGAELTAENDTMLYAPEGCAHGYQTLVDNTATYYLTSAAFAPASARGVRYNDPAFGITWPQPVTMVSKPDQSWPDFALPPAAAPHLPPAHPV